MKRTTFFLILLSAILTGCGQAVPSIPVSASPTATAHLPSPTPRPPTGSPSPPPADSQTPAPTPLRATPTLHPTSPTPPPAQPDQQVYTDPDGWFAISLPADWEPGNETGTFFGNDGLMIIRFLPDLGFMTNLLNVAMWQANIEAPEPENTKIQLDGSITVDSGNGEGFQYLLFENPSADYAHRFVRLTMDEPHADAMRASFRWLRPAEKLPRGARPAFDQMPLRPEDAAVWENAVPLPEGIAWTETALTAPGQQVYPGSKPLTDMLPGDISGRRKKMIRESSGEHPTTEELLSQFGYRLEEHPGKPYTLYRNDELIFDNVYKADRAAIFPTDTGEMLTFAVRTVEKTENSPIFHDYIVQDGEIIERRFLFNDPSYKPVMVNGAVLWVRVDGTHVLVETSEPEVIFDFSTYFGTNVPLRGFKAWNNHWVLEIGDFIVQDGEILNEKYNFQEAFDWHILNGKPFFFFRKGKRVGISYDGQILPIYYHDVLHGYG